MDHECMAVGDDCAAVTAGGPEGWESLDRDVRIEAVFRNGGHVDLTWRLAPWRGDDAWQAEVTFQVEAGGRDAEAGGGHGGAPGVRSGGTLMWGEARG